MYTRTRTRISIHCTCTRTQHTRVCGKGGQGCLFVARTEHDYVPSRKAIGFVQFRKLHSGLRSHKIFFRLLSVDQSSTNDLSNSHHTCVFSLEHVLTNTHTKTRTQPSTLNDRMRHNVQNIVTVPLLNPWGWHNGSSLSKQSQRSLFSMNLGNILWEFRLRG